MTAKFETLHLRLDSILEREFELGHQDLQLSGSNSLLSLGLALSQSTGKNLHSLPHLVVVGHYSDALKFQQILQFLTPDINVEILPAFDVSPYSGLEPGPRVQHERLRFLSLAQRAGEGKRVSSMRIFVAPISALLQKTLPFSALKSNSFSFVNKSEFDQDLPGFLHRLGYQASPLVEDVGQYSIRGGILDVFSPAHDGPVRVELFGDSVESMRSFSAADQHSTGEIRELLLIPCRETLWLEDTAEKAISAFRKSVAEHLPTHFREGSTQRQDFEEILRSLSRHVSFAGQDFCLPFFYEAPAFPVEHFSSELTVWWLDPMEISRSADQLLAERKADFLAAREAVLQPPVEGLYGLFDQLLEKLPAGRQVQLSGLEIFDFSREAAISAGKKKAISYSSQSVGDFSGVLSGLTVGTEPWLLAANKKLRQWLAEDFKLIVSVKNRAQGERLKVLLEKMELNSNLAEQDSFLWDSWLQNLDDHSLLIVPRALPESIRLNEERLIFLREQDFFGSSIGGFKNRERGKSSFRETSAEGFQRQASLLAFGDLKPGDCIVHVQHGIGVYEGLKIMNIGGAESEFIQIAYKDKDKLYLPVYRVGQLQKYSGAAATTVLDKLGGPGWEKTKAKVKNQLRDLANDLLALYAKRAELHRPGFALFDADFAAFESAFPYEETDDQDRAIRDLVADLRSNKPMDRLVCGDVGYGKTEVAMRATFVAAHGKKQVAVLAPTTILSFQHYETFRHRFKGWPFEIRALNRFVSPANVKKTIKEVKEGKVDILIGTHRLLSKDVEFKDLGLLIVDEEQKFGVAHKERIRKIKTSVDTLAMSATPIPRTLNMSLAGIRDLSLINTAPVDRLPTRTFVCRWEDETIRKSIEGEIARGGQVYFIHNRVQSIYGIADEVRKIIPQARIAVGHGQMEEHELEKVMISFFNHEIDVLICTTIVESGMDVSRANTMFIDQAHMMGLAQLYQLRGRVGRSKERAYCYLILPRDRKIDKDAQERLKIIQENTALGSGIRIAQYDLELRGAGNILGENQSGHINAVGYEMYMDLLNEAVHDLRGDPKEEIEVDPEINLRVPALIPEKYIHDIRLRLGYYKALAEIKSPEDLDRIEDELKDQFGPLPEPTLNLMGLMLIRHQCRYLGIKDVTSGPKNLSLIFSETTRMKPEVVIALAMKENKKYAITPDNRLNIRMNNVTWPAVYEELQLLRKLV